MMSVVQMRLNLTTIFINGRIRAGDHSSSEPLTVKEI